MAAFRVLIALFVFSVVTALAQQCDKAFEDFHTCMKNGEKKPQGAQQKPDFKDLKAKADKCFTDNGCDAPKMPGGQNGAAPAGGRAGRVGAGKAGNDDKRKCFEAVRNKSRDAMDACMKKADPSFVPSSKQGGKGGQSGEEHRGGHRGGPHGGFGGMHGGQGGQKFLLDACKNNADNAQKVNTCLSSVFPKHQAPSQDQMKQAFDARCKNKAACEAALGASCKAVMEKRMQARCTCSQQVDFQTLAKAEPACANVQQPQGGQEHGGQHKQRDCNQKPKDPCEEGFDAFVKSHGQHGGPGQH